MRDVRIFIAGFVTYPAIHVLARLLRALEGFANWVIGGIPQ